MLNDILISRASQMLKILADPTRLRILLTLEETEYSVNGLAEELGLEQSALSHQLSILRRERLVKARRDGKSVFYNPDDRHIYTILAQVKDHVKEDPDRTAAPAEGDDP